MSRPRRVGSASPRANSSSTEPAAGTAAGTTEPAAGNLSCMAGPAARRSSYPRGAAATREPIPRRRTSGIRPFRSSASPRFALLLSQAARPSRPRGGCGESSPAAKRFALAVSVSRCPEAPLAPPTRISPPAARPRVASLTGGRKASAFPGHREPVSARLSVRSLFPSVLPALGRSRLIAEQRRCVRRDEVRDVELGRALARVDEVVH